MKERFHISLDPDHLSLLEKWSLDGDRSRSAQIARLIRQEQERLESPQTSDNGARVRAE
jgi:hypothetical protein